MINYIKPNWPAPKNIQAYTSKRTGGMSQPPYASFNFSLLTGDDSKIVLANRRKLMQELNLPQEPFWLKQEHSSIVINLNPNTFTTRETIIADAAFTTTPNSVCAVLTADCIPILICDQAGTIVAAIHAGWKGIAAEIIGNTILAMDSNPQKLLAWLGPAIGPSSFLISREVRNLFLQKIAGSQSAFTRSGDRFLTNLYWLAALRLKEAGVNQIYGGDYCTFTQSELFFSFRRDGEKTGRMVSLIWMV